MNWRSPVVVGLVALACLRSAAGQDTVFYSGFEYATEPLYGLLEAADLNGASSQVGFWSGDDFPEADGSGFFSGGVFGGDSAGLADAPQSGQLLFIDRPLDSAFQFMNLSRKVPNTGAQFSFQTGLGRPMTGDYDFFGLDSAGNESFRIRLGGTEGVQRLGYVSGGEVNYDLPTANGVDQAGDIANLGQPPLAAETRFANVAVSLLDDGYVLEYSDASRNRRFDTQLLPYNGTASSLTRVGIAYAGDEFNHDAQSSFYLDEVRVTTGDPVTPPPTGGFSAYLDSRGQIVLEGSGQSVLGLDFLSGEGLLVPAPGNNAAPFSVLLSNTPNRMTYGSLGTGVKVDGELVTTAKYTGADPENELTAVWGDEEANQFRFVVENPEPVSGFVNDDGKIVVVGTGQQLLGLNFFSEAGLLVPVGDGDADPFQFLLSNTPEQVTYGMLGTPLLLDGELELGVGYRGPDARSDVTANWGGAAAVINDFIVRGGVSGLSPLDCNGDGIVDGRDLDCSCVADTLDATLSELGLIKGDLDLDGRVDFSDFLAIGDTFGQAVDSYLDGDMDCDGFVGFADFLIIAENFGMSSEAAAAVPEPAAAWLASMVLLAAMVRRRRSRRQVV